MKSPLASAVIAVPDATPLPFPKNDAWRDALLRPEFWPDRTERIDVLETHISWVYLTRRHAFKLKKPVAYDFLDFRTLAARKSACEDEVRLNRRLAPEVYLGVKPLTAGGPLGVELAGSGAVIDYVVQMRRLPEAQRLDRILAAGQWNTRFHDQVRDLLVRFYSQAPPLMIRAEAYLATFERHVRENSSVLSATGDLPAEQVLRTAQAQLRVLQLAPELLLERACDGRVIDGHGDLRPEHLYLLHEPVALDCIEFSAEFRQIDVADELGFLAMECAALDHAEVGEQLRDDVLAKLADRPAARLQAFYQAYRATVRAKVAALRARQQQDADRQASLALARRYLDLADRYSSADQRLLLLIVAGSMGCGKSTLARELAQRLNMPLLQTDVVRQQAAAAAPQQAEAFGAGKYEASARRSVYEQLLALAEPQLNEHVSVILDGTFSERSVREGAVALADRCNAEPILVWCNCPAAVARQRIEQRLRDGGDASEARPELVDQHRQQTELPRPAEHAIHVDTLASLPEQVRLVLEQLPARLA